MTYIPHTDAERSAMLGSLGLKSLDDLFSHLAPEIKAKPLTLPPGLNEMELSAEMARRAHKNRSGHDLACFLGGGAYDHFIPPVVDQLIMRGELYTAYTPYQPEISQGILQIIYEYQTMMAALCGCDVANASLYDGATALLEGCQMALRHTGRSRLVIDGTVHPHYLETARAVLRLQNITLDIVEPRAGEFFCQPSDLAARANGETAAIVTAFPNFYGAIQPLSALADAAHKAEALFIASCNPFAFGLLQPAGSFGADIVCGEAQALGVPLNFGGPYLGYVACKKELVRRMPGRLVGQTLDAKGRRAFTLTLQAREQHIRREKATSNICTNEALCAMMAHFYMSCLGPSGLKRAGELCVLKTDELRKKLKGAKGIVSVPEYPVFNEFVVETAKPAAQVLEKLLSAGILGGLDLGRCGTKRANQLLVAVTEKRSSEEIEKYVQALS